MIYEAIVKKKKRKNKEKISKPAEQSDLVSSHSFFGFVGRGPSKLPEGISVGSMAIIFSLFTCTAPHLRSEVSEFVLVFFATFFVLFVIYGV